VRTVRTRWSLEIEIFAAIAMIATGGASCASQNTSRPGVVTEYRVGPFPGSIAHGPDGNIWFIQGQSIGRLTPKGRLTTFEATCPNEIASDQVGSLWFTCFYVRFSSQDRESDGIGRITVDGKISFYPLPTSTALPDGIVRGPLNSMWFTESLADKIGRINRTGRIYEYDLPHKGSRPESITTDRHGNIWFTEGWRDAIGRLSASGKVSEFLVPRINLGARPHLALTGITLGPDGNIWFVESNTGRIGRLTPNGLLKEYQIPTPRSGPDDIVAGPDGNLWFTEAGVSKIGRITPGGEITEFSTPHKDSVPRRIVVGPGTRLWFTEEQPFRFLNSIWGGIAEFAIR
jgi:streptogramin lyase